MTNGSVEIYERTVQRGGDVYYIAKTSQVGNRYAQQEFLISSPKKGQVYYTEPEAKAKFAKYASEYLNIPIFDIKGFESYAPPTATIGQATYERQLAAEASRQNIEQLHQRREALRQRFAGTFGESEQKIAAAPVGTVLSSLFPIPQTPGSGKPPAGFGAKVVPEIEYHYESPFGKGILKKENFPGAYRQTPIGKESLVTMPLYKGAAVISRGSQAIVEAGIERIPFPSVFKEAGKGVSSLVTGIPEFFASGISGLELAARKPEMFKAYAVPAVKEFGGAFAQQATERPAYTAGQLAGILFMGRGAIARRFQISAPKMPKQIDVFAPSKGMKIEAPKGKITTWNRAPTPEYIRAKFTEYNVFKGGDIGALAKSLKSAPTSQRFPPQIKPMGIMRPSTRPISLPKQITTEKPIVGLKITELKTPPPPKSIETGAKFGQILIQRQKVIQKPKIEIIQAPKVSAISKTKAVQSLIIKTIALPKIVSKPATVSAMKAFSIQKASPALISAQRTKVTPASMFRTVEISKPIMSVMPVVSTRQLPKMKPITALKPMQESKAMPRMKTLITTKQAPLLRQIKRSKLSAPRTKALRIGKQPRKAFGKFEEMAGVASPMQFLTRRL